MRKIYLIACLLICFQDCTHINQTYPSRHILVTYSFSIKEIPSNAEEIKIWIPIPESNSNQTAGKLSVRFIGLNQDTGYQLNHDKIYGNNILFIKLRNPPEQISAEVTFPVERRPAGWNPELLNGSLRERLLLADRLGIIDEQIISLSRSITAGRDKELLKVRAIYDYVLDHMEYDKTLPGWGKGDTKRACEVGRGNCTDYHALFISLTRASGIPARFIYGALIPQATNGNAIKHCWAEAYVDGGWTPCDISEADKNPALRDYLFGHLDTNRVEFSKGRDIILEPSQDEEPLNFFIESHVEVDGKYHNRVESSIFFKEGKW